METRPWIRVARTNRKTILALRAGGGKGGNLMGFTPDKQYLASHRALCVAPRANDAPAAEEEEKRDAWCVCIFRIVVTRWSVGWVFVIFLRAGAARASFCSFSLGVRVVRLADQGGERHRP